MKTEDVILYYKSIVSEESDKLQILKKKIFQIGTLRLAVVLLIALLTVILWKNTTAVILAVSICVFVFLCLLKYHERLHQQKSYAETKKQYATDELKAFEYDFSAFDGAEHKQDPKHRFASDLDLFGNKSFFQSVNRTVTSFGTDFLAATFLAPPTNKDFILKKQESIKELASKHSFVMHYTTKGMLMGKDKLNTKDFSESFKQTAFFKNRFWSAAIYVVPLVYAILTVLAILNIVPYVFYGALWLVTFILSLIPSKQVKYIADIFDKKTEVLKKYESLFSIIEKESLETKELEKLKSCFVKDNIKASKAINRLKFYYDCLEMSFAYPVLLVFNPVLLWNVKYAAKIEEWISKYSNNVELWFSALAEFDSYVSLSIYAYNHQEYTYPAIADEYTFTAKSLGHPMLHRDVCVKNDVKINKRPFFLVVTGANMAGKSTYLRTIGINHVLACVGAPVCADKLTVFPCKLVTNLRTTDSLNDNESYFFAELKRLKMIIDRLNSGETLFIILDEILKGTNSEDKQKGSLALIKQLITLNSNGIIATHDLVLGDLHNQFPEDIKNYRFEADIVNNKLSFSYKIREGVAQNMNATFLMREMGITGV